MSGLDPLILVSGLFTIVLGLCGVIMTLIMGMFNQNKQQTVEASEKALEAKATAIEAQHQVELVESRMDHLLEIVKRIEQHSIQNYALINDLNARVTTMVQRGN